MNREWAEKRIFIHEGIVPIGPAFAYEEVAKRVIGVNVNGYLSENIWLEDEGAFGQKLLGYRCNVFGHAENLMGNWDVHDVFATMEAERETKFTAVDLPFEVYRDALGVNDKGERVGYPFDDSDDQDEPELQSCCANISEARDLLIRCMLNKGLEKWRIDYVVDLLKGSHPEFLEHGTPDNLQKIFDALGIKTFGKLKNPCMTCGEKEGTERIDHGIPCGVHCDECFDEMVRDARSRSW